MSELILANMIKSKCATQADLDVLTFVAINKEGQFEQEIRTYQQLWDNGQKLAHYLKSKGLVKGDRFALLMANHAEFVDFMVASSILGTIFVPIDPRTQGEKLAYMLDFSECKAAIVGDYALDNINEVWSARADVWFSHLTGVAEELSNAATNSQELNINSIDPDAPMQMLFTSGTTGSPKAIIAAHRRFGETAKVGSLLGLTVEDRPYTGLSLTHANAQLITLGCVLEMGMRGVISLKFTKSRLWDITRHYGCTFFNLLGGMTTAIFAEPIKENDAENPVKRILSAGMPAAIWKDFSKRFDVDILEFYGAAEGGLTFNPTNIGPIGSCGKAPESLKLKIFDENDRECAAGEAGEICFRPADGSAPVINYFKNEQASINKKRGGWLRMGDIGHVDENGWLYFHFRKGGGIRRNGDFINTDVIEKVFSQLSEVKDVFIYGVPSKNGVPGEKDLVAAIVLASDITLDVKNIYHQASQKLSSGVMPNYLHIVDQIPKTASEKPQERFLLDAFDPQANYIQPLI